MIGIPERARLARVMANVLETKPWLRLWRSAQLPTPKKSGELIHGANDVPPHVLTAFLGAQHVGLVRIELIYPALVIQSAGLSTEASINMLSLAMIALGVAAILQSLPR